MTVKFLYDLKDENEVNDFARRLIKNADDIRVVKRFYNKRTKIIIFANDENVLKEQINKLKKGFKFSVLTSNISPNYILKCLEISNSICYVRGTISTILKVIKK